MACDKNKYPTYIQRLTEDPLVRYYLRAKHNSCISKLEEIKYSGRKLLRAETAERTNNDFLVLPNTTKDSGPKETLLNKEIGIINDSENGHYVQLTTIDLNGSIQRVAGVDVSDYLETATNQASAYRQIDEDMRRMGLTAEDVDDYFSTEDPLDLSSYANVEISEDTLNKLMVFAEKMGITIEEVDRLVYEHGVVAAANINKRLVEYLAGYSNRLPEEISHILVGSLPKNHPLFIQMMNEIGDYELYNRVKAEYSKLKQYQNPDGTPNIEKIKMEAVGQLIAQQIYKINQGIESTEMSQPESWLRSVLNWLKSKFANLFREDNVFAVMANKILEGDITDLTYNDHAVIAEHDGLFFSRKNDYEAVATDPNLLKEKEAVLDLLKDIPGKLANFKMKIPKVQEGDRKVISDIQLHLEELGLTDESDQEDYINDMAKAYVDLVVESNALYKSYLNRLENVAVITDEDIRIAELNEILTSIILLDRVLADITNVSVKLSAENVINKEYVNNILGVRKRIDKLWQGIAISSLSKVFANDVFSDLNRKLNSELEAEMQQLEARKSEPGADIQELNRGIDEIKQELAMLPSEENVTKLLQGLSGDIGMFSAYIQKAIATNDFAVAGIKKRLEELLLRNAQSMIRAVNRMDTAMSEYTKATGISINDDEALFDPITTVVTKTVGYDENGNPITTQRIHLLNEFDPKYKMEIDDLFLKLEKTNEKLRITKDAKEVETLKEQRRIILDDIKAFNKKMEQKYTSEYYKMLDDVLDEKLTDDNGEVFTAREETADIYSDISNARRDMEMSDNTERMLSAIATLESKMFELERMKTVHDKVPGTKEYVLAKQLRLYEKNRKQIVTYKTTERSRNLFEVSKRYMKEKLDSGTITQEDYDTWKKHNIVKRAKQEYIDRRLELIKKINDILDLYVPKDETTSQLFKDLYEQLEDISKKYRDENGIIDGNELSNEEIAKVKAIELNIQKLKDSLEKLTGLSRDENEELRELSNKLKAGIKDNDERKESENRLAELNKKRSDKLSIIDQEDLNEYYSLQAELNSMSNTLETEYYKARFDEELSKHAATVTVNLSERDTIVIDGNIFNKTPSGTWMISDGSLELSEPEMEMKAIMQKARDTFSTSEWFINNHISVMEYQTNPYYVADAPISEENFPGRYTQKNRPIWVWRFTEPSDPAMVDEEAPGFQYLEREVKSEYINPNFRDFDGYPVPKPGEYVDQKYKALSESKDPKDIATFKFLKTITEIYEEGQKFITDSYSRPGTELPTIPKGGFETVMKGINMGSLMDGMDYFKQELKRQFSVTAQDKDNSYNEDISEEDLILRNMPVLYQSKLDLNLQLRDAAKAILIFYGMAATRHSISESKPLYNVLLKTVSNSDLQAPKKTRTGIISKVFKPGKNSNRYIRMKDVGERTYLHKDKVAMMVKTPWGEFDIAKLMGGLISFSSISNLGLRIASPIKNYIAGVFQIGLTSVTDSDIIGLPNIPKAQMYVAARSKDLVMDALKAGNRSLIGQAADFFGFGDLAEGFGRKLDTSATRMITDLKGNLMLPRSIVETEQKYVQAVAVLMTQMVKRNGTLIPIIDAIELDNTNTITFKKGVEITEKEIARVRALIKEVNARANGNIDKLDAALVEKYVLGRAAFHMNKFIPSTWTYRYSAKRINYQTNKIDYGFYVETANRLYEMLKDAGYNPIKAAGKYKYQRQRAKNAMAAVALETATIVTLFGLAALAGAYDPDRNKKLKQSGAESYFKAQLINLLLSANSEIQTGSPIFGIDNMLRKASSPFVVLSTVKLMRRTLLHGITQETYKRDTGIWKKGDSKFIADLFKLSSTEALFLDVKKPYERLLLTETGQRFNN